MSTDPKHNLPSMNELSKEARQQLDSLVEHGLGELNLRQMLAMALKGLSEAERRQFQARSEGHELYFGCNLMHRKVLVSSHQHLVAEAPNSSSSMNSLATVSSSCSETDKPRFLRAVLAALIERLEASSASSRDCVSSG